MSCNIVYDIAYDIAYDIVCSYIITDGLQINQSVSPATAYAII